MSVSVWSYDDLEHEYRVESGVPDRNPSMPCNRCGQKHAWQDYWKDLITSYDDPRDAPFICKACLNEEERAKDRYLSNRSIMEWCV